MVNKVILVGNVGQDPEVNQLSSGTEVASISLATSERGYTKKDGSEVEAKTEWHKVVFWRGLAKVVSNYVKKGSLLYIEGKLCTRTWKDKEGNTRFATEVIASEMKMLGGQEKSQKKSEKEYEENDDLPF